MPPKVTVKLVVDNTQAFFGALDELMTKSVFVGVPSTKVERDPDPGQKTTPNNATIAYVQENGDPKKNIPPRPFLVPAIKAEQPAIIKRLKDISLAALSADLGKVQRLRIELGLYAQRAVQQKITDGPFIPLAKATLLARVNRKFGKGAAGARRGAKLELARRAAGGAAGTDLARPLIDTGQLRRAINFVVGPNRSKKKSIRAMLGTFPVFTGSKK